MKVLKGLSASRLERLEARKMVVICFVYVILVVL